MELFRQWVSKEWKGESKIANDALAESSALFKRLEPQGRIEGEVALSAMGNDEKDCAICKDPLEELPVGVTISSGETHSPYETRCGHRFGKSCLMEWLSANLRNSNKTCPTCRSKLFPPFLLSGDEGAEEKVAILEQEMGYLRNADIKSITEATVAKCTAFAIKREQWVALAAEMTCRVLLLSADVWDYQKSLDRMFIILYAMCAAVGVENVPEHIRGIKYIRKTARQKGLVRASTNVQGLLEWEIMYYHGTPKRNLGRLLEASSFVSGILLCEFFELLHYWEENGDMVDSDEEDEEKEEGDSKGEEGEEGEFSSDDEYEGLEEVYNLESQDDDFVYEGGWDDEVYVIQRGESNYPSDEEMEFTDLEDLGEYFFG